MKKKLQLDQIKALKNGDKERLNILRYLLSKIKNKEINKREELTNEEVITVLRKERKELQDSIASLKETSRQELIKEYQQQINIINAYLPQELSDQDLKREINKIIIREKNNLKNPNSLIGLCVKELKGKAEAKRIVAILRSL